MKDEVDRKVIQQLARDLGLQPNEVREMTITPREITVTIYELDDEGRKQIKDDEIVTRVHSVRVVS